MKKVILTIGLLLLNISVPAYSANWLEIMPKIYIDTESIDKYHDSFSSNLSYSIWTKMFNNNTIIFEKIGQIINQSPEYVLTQHIIDCKSKKIATKVLTYYGTNATVIDTYEFEPSLLQWRSIIPDSLGDCYFQVICQPKNF